MDETTEMELSKVGVKGYKSSAVPLPTVSLSVEQCEDRYPFQLFRFTEDKAIQHFLSGKCLNYEDDVCSSGHDSRVGADSEKRCLALAGCVYDKPNDSCSNPAVT